MDKFTIEMLFWAEQDLNEIAIYYKNLSNAQPDDAHSHKLHFCNATYRNMAPVEHGR